MMAVFNILWFYRLNLLLGFLWFYVLNLDQDFIYMMMLVTALDHQTISLSVWLSIIPKSSILGRDLDPMAGFNVNQEKYRLHGSLELKMRLRWNGNTPFLLCPSAFQILSIHCCTLHVPTIVEPDFSSPFGFWVL